MAVTGKTYLVRVEKARYIQEEPERYLVVNRQKDATRYKDSQEAYFTACSCGGTVISLVPKKAKV